MGAMQQLIRHGKCGKVVILLLLTSLLLGCGGNTDCEVIAPYLKDDQCLLIVHELKSDSRFDHKGVNPYTGKFCDCNSQTSDRWWQIYNEHIQVGDTLIKKREN